jgi:glycosyltransferase involved in cell wall biosynthesis
VKIALVHDWLDTLGGAERVLIELHQMFSDAPIYTLFARKEFIKEYLPEAKIITSWLQRMPFRRSAAWAPLMVTAIEGFDFSAYDLVISSSVFFSKGIIVRPKTKHICYCYSPTRQLWDRNIESHQGIAARIGKHFLRLWDRTAAERPDELIAISQHVKDRIQKFYKRNAVVIYPPMTLVPADPQPRENFYLLVSRLYASKNIHIAIEAFNKLGYTLRIVGTGPEERRLRTIAGPNIEFLGFQSNGALTRLYCQAKACIMPQEEDFGLTPIEAMAHGTPVIALRKGGAVEFLEEGVTGEFFDDPIPEGLADAVRRFRNHGAYAKKILNERAAQFSPEQFRQQINEVISRYRQF